MFKEVTLKNIVKIAFSFPCRLSSVIILGRISARTIYELFKVRNPYFDKNLEAHWNLEILLKNLSVPQP